MCVANVYSFITDLAVGKIIKYLQSNFILYHPVEQDIIRLFDIFCKSKCVQFHGLNNIIFMMLNETKLAFGVNKIKINFKYQRWV